MGPKLKEFFAFAAASSLVAGIVILRSRFESPWKDPRPLLAALTDEQKRRLARNFQFRRRAAIAALVLPLLLLLMQTVFGEKAGVIFAAASDAAPIAWVGTLVLFAAGIVFTVFVYRCPFCRATPESIMEGTGTFGFRSQSHKGLDLFPAACKNCGLEFKVKAERNRI